ncbi:MAG: hypothetical protein QW611_07330 [Ignisphaera sp.]
MESKKRIAIYVVVIIVLASITIYSYYYLVREKDKEITPKTLPTESISLVTETILVEISTPTTNTIKEEEDITKTTLTTPTTFPQETITTVINHTTSQPPLYHLSTETFPQEKGLAMNIIYYPKTVISCYEKIEVMFNISNLMYRNPYNSSDIDVVGYIYTPNNEVIKIPAFYTRNYTIQSMGSREHIVLFNTPPLWALRFTPKVSGEYRVVIEARNSSGVKISSEELKIQVSECRNKRGFISIDESKKFLVFEDGSSEIMLGINLAWPPNKLEAISFYSSWFKRLKELGVKVVRIGLVPWSLNLEWSNLNRYSLADAARIDEIIRLAEEHDIYIIFVFMWHNELADDWGNNPYNALRGGPIKNPEEFWSNPIAIDIFKNKVRYIIARWGYSPHILAWELVNEADLTSNFFSIRDAFVNWVKEISSYVKLLDPYKRPVTVNLADYNSEPRVWNIESIDLITVHRYGPTGFKDIGSSIPSIIDSLWNTYRKPVVITEFGVDYRWIGMQGFTGIPYWAIDREGIGLHEGLWSSTLSGSPISAMSWWWDTQIERYNLFYHFKALSEFLKGVDPVKGRLSRLNVYVESASTIEGNTTSLILYPSAGWIWVSPVKQNIYTIHPNGKIEGDTSLLSGFVYGKGHNQRTLNPIFIVTFLDRGRMILNVNSVGRGSAVVSIYVNNTKIEEEVLPDIDGKSDEDANEYNIDITIDFEPGTYEIRIDNEGIDWYTWNYIVFENTIYASAKVQAIGLGNKSFAIMWIRNTDFNWWNYAVLNKSPIPLKNVVISVEGLEDGMYVVEFWDTFRGEVVESKEVMVTQGKARISIDSLEKDLALKMYKTE